MYIYLFVLWGCAYHGCGWCIWRSEVNLMALALPSTSGAWGWHSAHQVWWQAPLPTPRTCRPQVSLEQAGQPLLAHTTAPLLAPLLCVLLQPEYFRGHREGDSGDTRLISIRTLPAALLSLCFSQRGCQESLARKDSAISSLPHTYPDCPLRSQVSVMSVWHQGPAEVFWWW